MARAPKSAVRAFVHEYVWGDHAGNATECARIAGLCKGNRKSQAQYGWRLLRKPAVRVLVEAQFAERETLLKQKAARVAEETYRLATVDIAEVVGKDGKLLDLRKMPEDARRAIASIEVEELFEGTGKDRTHVGVLHKVKLHDKKGAQELFLKYSGKLKDKVELEASETLEQLIDAALKLKE
jgi:phage terminase small subunit